MTTRSLFPRAAAPHRFARRAAACSLAAVVIGASPLVAHAQEDSGQDATASTSQVRKPVFQPVDDEPVDESDEQSGEQSDAEPAVVATPRANPIPAPAVESVVDPTVAVLTDTYEWDERGPRVTALQEILGVAADGWYGQQTAATHRAALEAFELSTDDLPSPVLPPGPSAAAWAALRDCEAGGDYSITNPSGKYRGAYQFDRSTWDSVASRNDPGLVGVDPAAAAPADQDAMALALYHERGARPWPNCGRHLN